MSRVCQVTNRGTRSGQSIARRGLPKKKGGIGLHITAVTKRRFQPNLQKIRVKADGQVSRKLVCTACLRSGAVVKA